MLLGEPKMKQGIDNSVSNLSEKNQGVVLDVKDIKVHFSILKKGSFFQRQVIKAVDGVSFQLFKGEVLGIVGESGSGKSTLARSIIRVINPTSGTVNLLGKNFTSLAKSKLRAARRHIQMIFQDPLGSLDPRMTAEDIIAEPLHTFYPQKKRAEIRQMVIKVMDDVGLIPEHLERYPHEFSGGQCQRIGIARALILKPEIIICDEPVSALDVSIQAQIVNLLKVLQKKLSLSLIFIAHDLSIVKHMSDRVLIMNKGKIVEIGTKYEIYTNPKHEYTKILLDSVPLTDPNCERERMAKLKHHRKASKA